MLEEILQNKKITQDTIQDFLTKTQIKSVDYSDCYFQHSLAESWVLDEGIIQDGSYHITHGLGVRSISQESVGFAYCDDLNAKIIADTIGFVNDSIKTMATKQSQLPSIALSQVVAKQHYTANNPLQSLTDVQKIDMLKQADTKARKNPLVSRVNASLSGAYTEVLIAASDGTYALDYRPMVRFNVSVVVEKDGRVEQAGSGGGGRYTYEYFLENDLIATYVEQALRQAMVALESKASPGGVMPVILAPGWPGVLLHEAIGHGLEGDFNRKKTSVYSEKLNTKIASEFCTIVDNGTMSNRRGSLTIDDEGTPTQENVLVKEGILQQYMTDKHNAKLMGTKSTGNGRRESYAHLPLPRMTNTYMLNGQHKLEEMIASVEQGIYCVNFDGGQVDVTSGKFVFSANEAYLVKNGKIQHPVKGVTLIGQGDEVLKDISMLGDDLALDSGVGVCGKEGQSIPVGVGQPSMKIDQLTVGGSELG